MERRWFCIAWLVQLPGHGRLSTDGRFDANVSHREREHRSPGSVSRGRRELKLYLGCPEAASAPQKQHRWSDRVLNHKALERRLGDELGQAARNQNIVAVLFVNVDRFKSVNEVHGHEAGDTLLENVARRLRENVRSNDLVGRVGGDEFMVVLTGLRQPDPVSKIAEKLVDVLNQPFSINGKIIKVTASIGIAFYPEDGSTAKALTNSSNNAMLAVKDRSRNSFVFSDQGMRVEHTRRIMLERLLPQALAEDELELAFQPQIDLQDNSLIGFEALLRWRNKELGQVSPAEFIPIAEDSGLIVPIRQWVLREACHQAMDWQRKGLRPVKMAVNVSWVQFQQQNFLNSVGLALRDSGLDSRLLEIEITEGVLMKNGDMTKELLTSLTRHGVDIALDDFGTGYSSLAYLQDFPIKNLKIDRLSPPYRSPLTAGWIARSRSSRRSAPWRSNSIRQSLLKASKPSRNVTT